MENRLKIGASELHSGVSLLRYLLSVLWIDSKSRVSFSQASSIGGLCSTEKERLNLWLLYSYINQHGIFINFSHAWFWISEIKWFFLCCIRPFWTELGPWLILRRTFQIWSCVLHTDIHWWSSWLQKLHSTPPDSSVTSFSGLVLHRSNLIFSTTLYPDFCKVIENAFKYILLTEGNGSFFF